MGTAPGIGLADEMVLVSCPTLSIWLYVLSLDSIPLKFTAASLVIHASIKFPSPNNKLLR